MHDEGNQCLFSIYIYNFDDIFYLMSSQGLVVPVLRNVERMNYADVEEVPDTVEFIVPCTFLS